MFIPVVLKLPNNFLYIRIKNLGMKMKMRAKVITPMQKIKWGKLKRGLTVWIKKFGVMTRRKTLMMKVIL